MRKIILLGATLVVLGGIFGTIYATVQQSLRMSANDPQIQLAEDTAAALDAGRPLAALSSTDQYRPKLGAIYSNLRQNR